MLERNNALRPDIKKKKCFICIIENTTTALRPENLQGCSYELLKLAGICSMND